MSCDPKENVKKSSEKKTMLLSFDRCTPFTYLVHNIHSKKRTVYTISANGNVCSMNLNSLLLWFWFGELGIQLTDALLIASKSLSDTELKGHSLLPLIQYT